jgi:response regulator NasT
MAAIRILVAEDNDLVALTLEEQLKSLGYDVIAVAHTGAEAIDLAARLSPDLIIMDIRMPEVEGTEAAARINASRPTPILMLTAYTDRETIRRAEVAGALGYLVKPVNEAELSPAINIALARFKELQGLRSQVTELEESLEARKLVERRTAADDARAVEAHLTDAGLDLVRAAQASHFASVQERFFSELSAEEIETLAGVFSRFAPRAAEACTE